MKTSFIFTPIIVLLKTIALPVILTGIVYYLLNPIVDILEKIRVKRVYSILLLYLIIIGLITITVVSIIPFLKEQIMSLIDNLPKYVDIVEDQTKSLIGSDFVNQAQKTMNINISDLANKVSAQAATIANSTFTGVGNFIGALTEVIISIVTVPFILFYLLKDGKKLPIYILKFVPTRLKEQTYTMLSEMNHRLSSYIRGQVIVSFCIGFLLFIGYLIIGLDYASLLAVIAACTSVVPYLGPTIAITPAIIIALVTSPLIVAEACDCMDRCPARGREINFAADHGEKSSHSPDYHHLCSFNRRKAVRGCRHYFSHPGVCGHQSGHDPSV